MQVMFLTIQQSAVLQSGSLGGQRQRRQRQRKTGCILYASDLPHGHHDLVSSTAISNQLRSHQLQMLLTLPQHATAPTSPLQAVAASSLPADIVEVTQADIPAKLWVERMPQMLQTAVIRIPQPTLLLLPTLQCLCCCLGTPMHQHLLLCLLLLW